MNSSIKWPPLAQRIPTAKETGRYHRWMRYLSNSKLTKQEQHERACTYAGRGEDPPINE